MGVAVGVDALEPEVGDVDVLVNNAGIATGGEPVWASDPEASWAFQEVNVRAPMWLIGRLLPGMIERRAGTVIILASLVGARPSPMVSAYSVSKAVLARLGDTVAGELQAADHNVSVFTTSPGLVRPEITAGTPSFEELLPEAWMSIEAVGESVSSLVSGDFDPLSDRIIHLAFDRDDLVANADRIDEEGLYVLLLPGMDGLVE